MRKMTTLLAAITVLVAVAWTSAAIGIPSGFGRPLRALGIESMDCSCSQVVGDDADVTLWTFSAEPRIKKVDRDGPAGGQLKPGDSIVAVDGYLITTVEGGRRFSHIAPGTPVVLTLRRGKQTRDETIVPKLIDDETPLIVGLDSADSGDELLRLSEQVEKLSRMSLERTKELQRRATLLSPRRDKLVITLEELRQLTERDLLRGLDELTLPELPGVPDLDLLSDIGEASPQGSFGFALSFSGSIKTGKGHDPVWRFNELPEIHTVDPGSPADKAGLRPDDVLTRIDGVELDSDEGGRRFSEVRPGQRVVWTIRRDGKEETIETVAEGHDERSHDESRVRYSGSLGDTEIEVKGDRRVRVTEDGDVITIRTGDATIELRRSKRD